MTRRFALLALLLLAPAVREVAAQDTLRVLTLNLWHDQRDWPARRDLIVDEARRLRPDVILLQEVLQHATLQNQAEDLARRLDMPSVYFASVDTVTRERRYGNAILSRLPFDTTAERKLRPLNQWRIAAFARVRLNGRPLRFYSTHLHHTEDVEGGGIRAMESRDLLAFMDETATLDGRGATLPLVLGGDLNMAPEWPEFRMLTGAYRDVPALYGVIGPTWGVAHGISLPGKRIDHILDARDPRLVPLGAQLVYDRPDAAGRWASDHFGVFARFLVY